MNPFVQQVVNQKINSITISELLQLAKQHRISLSTKQAEKIVSIVKEQEVDVANTQQVEQLLHRLQTEVDPHVTSVIQQLMQQFSQYL